MTGVQWSERISPEHYPLFHEFYARQWWTKGRSRADVARMLEHSDLTVFGHDRHGRNAAFARVLTDYVFKAMIFDVMVGDEYRGHGLGKAVVERILNHERLGQVKSFELYCPDRLMPFYEKLGFVKGSASLLFNQALTDATAS